VELLLAVSALLSFLIEKNDHGSNHQKSIFTLVTSLAASWISGILAGIPHLFFPESSEKD
jgi:hypothetical protein